MCFSPTAAKNCGSEIWHTIGSALLPDKQQAPGVPSTASQAEHRPAFFPHALKQPPSRLQPLHRAACRNAKYVTANTRKGSAVGFGAGGEYMATQKRTAWRCLRTGPRHRRRLFASALGVFEFLTGDRRALARAENTPGLLSGPLAATASPVPTGARTRRNVDILVHHCTIKTSRDERSHCDTNVFVETDMQTRPNQATSTE